MGTRRCMNAGCGATEAGGEWKKGWGLRSGGFANLCYKCGMAYEQLVFCDMFHLKESGWRECNICGKRLHCGCVASRCFVDLLDGGGVQCISCMKGPEHSFIPNIVVQEFLPQQSHTAVALSAQHVKDGIANEVGTAQCASELLPASADGMMDSDAGNKGQAKAIHLLKQIESNGQSSVLLSQRDCIDGSFGQIRLEQVASYIGEAGSIRLSNRTQGPLGSSYISLRNENENAMADNMVCESLGQACLSIGLGTSNPSNMMEATSGIGIPHTVLHLTGADIEGKDHSKVPSTSRQVQRACHFIPVPPKAGDAAAPEATKNVLSHMRVARPPGEGRGRNQLLPRYWPRITEQELQQISGDSNSTIVPLFEKVLSASDAGRIGRLVLPKACAEAYFPPISQPEGLPLTIQDAKGKDWHFQFRYWPNNNSRMYVLEGVTPCIQSLQLQAGDTVTFSRIDPEGKLVMGFRKATNSVPLQDSQISAIANGALGNENFLLGASENLPVLSGYSICQSVKGTADPQSCSLSEHLNSADGIISCRRTDKHVGRANGGLSLPPLLLPDRRRSRNIGPKNKRLHMDNEDALELKLTWEEAQDLLRPPPSAKPSIVMIEDHEFEEYEEPPVFGKRTIFTARTSGGQDQWIQCDDCFKWRRLPVDVLVPSKWTCANNNCDPKRSSCSVPCELSSCELQDLLSQNADMKRRKITANLKQNSTEPEASGLEALAAAAALGDMGNQVTASAATTTRHPRHRPGCTCIVCIQPPSGKGPKHSPACTCNVCMTVKRRFRTLMMRKKQRQTELEEAEGQKKLPWGGKEEAETSSSLKNFQPLDPQRESDLVPSEMSKERIDLNFCPERDVESHMGLSSSRVSMMSLLKVASRPLEAYLQQNGLKSLALEQVVSSSSHTIPQATAESQGRTPDDSCVASVTREQESGADERCCKSDNVRNDAT